MFRTPLHQRRLPGGAAVLFALATVHGDVLLHEEFDATGLLDGRTPAVAPAGAGAWSADGIFGADGIVSDGANTDRTASLDLGAGFAFEENETYTLECSWTGLSNAILFAGFNTDAPASSARAQTQGTNFASRARLIDPTDKLAAWTYLGGTAATVDSPLTTPADGTLTLTLETRSLTDATFTIDSLAAPVAIDLSAGYRHLWIGYEDPTSGNSSARFTSLTLSGPAAPPPPPSVTISPAAGVLRDGETITLSSDPGVEIRYTLDGSEPDASSTLYAGPFAPPASATLQARTVVDGALGPLAEAGFIILPEAAPNVVIIVADDLGFNDLGCYGAVTVSTPRLDALSREGQRFTQFTTTGPGDLASQYALLTGRLARRGGLPASVSPSAPGLDSREWTLGETFRKQGYETAFIGAWHLGDQPGATALDNGFTLFHGLPWDPSLAPAPPRVENNTVLDPAPDPNTLLDTLTSRAESFLATHAADPFLLIFQAPSMPATGTSLLGSYGHRIEALDAAAGRLLDQLDASGIADRTLVLFLSDGGADRNTGTFPTGSNGQQRDGKGTTWEGGVRVPLIVRWPEAVEAADNYAVVGLADLLPTLAEIADGYLPPDHPYDGINRVDALLGERTSPDETTTLHLHRHTGTGYELQALRSGRWKLHQAYLNTDPDNAFSGTAPLLFDLLEDPSERIDRSGSQTGVLSSLQQLASQHEASFATPVPQLPPARDAILGPVETSLAETTETHATFSFTRPADSLNDHYVLQTGNDLTGWSDLAVDPYIAISDGPGETEIVEVTVPLETLGGSNSRFFARLKTVRP